MKNKYISEQGFMLAELVIGVSLIVILLSCFINLLSTSLKIWAFDKSHSNLQQAASIGVDAMTREIRYAKTITFNSKSSIRITKLDGEVNTFHLGGGLYSQTLYFIIDKTRATPAGGVSASPITENIVTELQFSPHPESAKAVIIVLAVTDSKTGKIHKVRTACYALNMP